MLGNMTANTVALNYASPSQLPSGQALDLVDLRRTSEAAPPLDHRTLTIQQHSVGEAWIVNLALERASAQGNRELEPQLPKEGACVLDSLILVQRDEGEAGIDQVLSERIERRHLVPAWGTPTRPHVDYMEIGRASCRERV